MSAQQEYNLQNLTNKWAGSIQDILKVRAEAFIKAEIDTRVFSGDFSYDATSDDARKESASRIIGEQFLEAAKEKCESDFKNASMFMIMGSGLAVIPLPFILFTTEPTPREAMLFFGAAAVISFFIGQNFRLKNLGDKKIIRDFENSGTSTCEGKKVYLAAERKLRQWCNNNILFNNTMEPRMDLQQTPVRGEAVATQAVAQQGSALTPGG